MIFLQGFIKFEQGISEKSDGQNYAIQGHFDEATIFKMAANKIVKLSMVSDFNEN
jgi:hypothetical protein